MSALDPAAIARWWHEQRAAQGLPDKITDPAILARLIALAFAGRDGRDGPRRDDAPAGRPRRRADDRSGAAATKGHRHGSP